MKLIIVGIALAIVIAAASWFCGWSCSQKDQAIDSVKTQMHDEHSEIAYRVKGIETKLDSMDKKLDLLVNIATRPYNIDVAR